MSTSPSLLHVSDLRQQLRQLGAKACHEERVLRAWAQVRPLDAGPERRKAQDYLPLALREALPDVAQHWQQLAQLHSEHPGADGSARLLVNLHDGQMVESVLLPRDGVCVSSQVGCAVACQFCMTGQSGLIRQLGSAEIVAQVLLARRLRPVKRVVFMGMGEPSHNLDAVLEAITFLGTEGGIGHKNLVFSTVGDERVFQRLPQQRVKPALALSLHTTDATLRRQLLPKAPDISPERLINAAEDYARATTYPIQYQWTLIAGVNDSEHELHNIARLLTGKLAMMNFIPFNDVDGTPFRRPSPERAWEMAQWLNQQGILTRLRDSAGQDVEGACGQLRARAIAVKKVHRASSVKA